MRRWDDRDESDEHVIDAAIRIMVVSYSIERMLGTLRKSASTVLRCVGHSPTTSGVSGLPCAAEFVWADPDEDAAQIPAEHHAAFIPPDVQDEIDRGGE